MKAKKRNLKTALAEGMVAGNEISETARIKRMNEIAELLSTKADLPNGHNLFDELNSLVQLGYARSELKEAREIIQWFFDDAELNRRNSKVLLQSSAEWLNNQQSNKQ